MSNDEKWEEEQEQNASEGAAEEPAVEAQPEAEREIPGDAEQPRDGEAEELEESEEADSGQQAQERRAARKAYVKKEIREWIVALVTALIVVLAVRMLLFTIIRVDGNSMYPTLHDGERLFVSVADVKFGDDIDRDAIVICHYPNRGRLYFVKRVVGVPGDVISRHAGVTYVNGVPLDPLGLLVQAGYDYDDYTLGEDEYFCVGDNRYDSHDSRDWQDGDPSRDVGPIQKDMIVGRVRQVIWPLGAIRSVK